MSTQLKLRPAPVPERADREAGRGSVAAGGRQTDPRCEQTTRQAGELPRLVCVRGRPGTCGGNRQGVGAAERRGDASFTEVIRWRRDVEQFAAARLADFAQGIHRRRGAPRAGAEARVRVGRQGSPSRLGVGRGAVLSVLLRPERWSLSPPGASAQPGRHRRGNPFAPNLWGASRMAELPSNRPQTTTLGS